MRRGNNENLVWGGKESSKKVKSLPAGNNGSYTFDVRDFPGDKAIFVTHVRLYDSRRCYSEAAPQIGTFEVNFYLNYMSAAQHFSDSQCVRKGKKTFS